MKYARRSLPTLDYTYHASAPPRWRWVIPVAAVGVAAAVVVWWVLLSNPVRSSASSGDDQVANTPLVLTAATATPRPASTATRSVSPTPVPTRDDPPDPTHVPATPSPVVEATLSEEETIDVGEVETPWEANIVERSVTTFTVGTGDTLWSIASKFGLHVDTLRWSNPALERNPDVLSVGTELTILPVDGVLHTVQAGDTVSSLAARYGVAQIDITGFAANHLSSPDDVRVGQTLIVPHGMKDLTRPTPEPADGGLAWPLVGTITQGYGPNHLAIDIGAPYGSPVFAVADGAVIKGGWASSGYGYTVVVDHEGGASTLYSHMKGALVHVGDPVSQGQQIGAVGSTGNSTGPHLHLEVIVDGERVNPLTLLPAGEPH